MSENQNKKQAKKKRKYIKPVLKKEKVMAFGAGCNGTPAGGRKSTAGSPDFCSTAKLLS